MTSVPRVERKNLAENSVDISRPAQIRDIEAAFDACATNFDLNALKHPIKPNVTAVESYEIFPNVEIWANTYDLFKFSERPGERPSDVRVDVDSQYDSWSTFLSRSKIPDWIVLSCDLWSRMATTSCHIT